VTWRNGITETRLGPDGPVVTLAYRQTGRQRLQFAVFMPVFVLAENAVITRGHAGFWHGPLIFAVGFAAVTLLLPQSAGTVITPEAVIVRRLARRSIAWCDIASITREHRRRGADVIVLREVGGRTTVLPGLGSSPLARDPAFDSKYATIAHWWTACRAAHGLAPATA
jgi:hypothetical protein